MKIRTNLFLLAATFVVLITLTGFIMFNTFGRINKEIHESNRAGRIIKDISELDIVTYEYLMHREKRMRQQWQLKYDSLGKILERVRKEGIHPESIPLIESMIEDYKLLGDLDSQLQTSFAERERLIEENKPEAEINIILAFEERLIAEVLMRANKITAQAFKLSAMIEQTVAQTQQRSNLIIIFSIIGFAIFSSYILFLTIRAITKPINELIKGAEIIGKGGLEHKIDLRTKNEMAQLANSFNKMTKDLKEIIVSRDKLDKEVTERKRTQEALLQSEKKFRKFFENAPDYCYMISPDGKILDINSSALTALGYKKDEIVGKPVIKTIYAPSSTEKAKKLLTKWKKTGKLRNEELSIITKTGNERTVLLSADAVRSTDGKLSHSISVQRDITESKQAGERLAKESTAIAAVINDMLRGEVDDAQTEKQVLDACLVATDSVYGMIGTINEHGKYDTTTYSSQSLQDCAFPEALAWEMSRGMTIRGIWGWPMLHGKPLLCNELQMHPDQVGLPKGHVPLHCFLGAPLNRSGNVVGMVAVANKPGGYKQEDMDTLIRLASVMSVSHQHRLALIASKRTGEELEQLVTERTKQLSESEAKSRTLVENIPQRIFFKDRNSVYITCNVNYARDLGITPEEIVMKTDYDFYPKDLAEKYRRDDKRIIKSGKTEDIEERYIKDGQKSWVQTVKTPVKDEKGKIMGVLGIFWDITERKRSEDQIRASLKEKEILLQEVHHRVKNNMQIISSLFSLQSGHIKDKQAFEIFKSSQHRVRSMALIHERLYQSKDFTRVDFAEYAQSLSSHLFSSHGINPGAVKLNLKIKDVFLDLNTAIPCGLIINELVSNSLKHAFTEDKKGKIEIAMHPLNKDEMEVIVSDNGVGLPKKVDFRKTDSLGLHLVNILAEDQLHGDIKLDRTKGTSFHIRFKVKR